MENTQQIKIFNKIDWQWVGLCFCFFVVGHLLPLCVIRLMISKWSYFAPYPYSAGVGVNDIIIIIISVVLISVIGCYIGYRSRRVTILEPGIAALFYIIVISAITPMLWQGEFQVRDYLNIFIMISSAFVIAVIGAYIGKIFQARKMKKSIS